MMNKIEKLKKFIRLGKKINIDLLKEKGYTIECDNTFIGKRTVVSDLIYFRKDNKVIDNIKDIELRTLLRGIK